MFDISSPKVSIPVSLFMALSPGLLVQLPDTTKPFTMDTSRTSVMFHALVFMLAYRILGSKIFGMVLTPADLIVPTVLFVVLSPGMFLTIPGSSKGPFVSGQTNVTAILTHALIFAIIFALLRKNFPSYY
jgi:hypothetical protein